MFQYHCLNPIAEKGLKLFGDNYKKTETADQCDAILVRSAKNARHGAAEERLRSCTCRCRRQ